MFGMNIYILYFSLSRNNRRLQEFQSTYHQGIIRTVASTDAAVTNMHFFFATTFILCYNLRGKEEKKKARSIEAFVYFQCFHSFQLFKVSLLKIKM